MIEQFKSLICDKNTKLLFQNPGKSNIIREVITYLDIALIPQIPNTGGGINDFKRKNYIIGEMIYIVDSNSIHTIWIRGCLGDPARTHSHWKTNVKFEDLLTFNYWNLPPNTFDIIVAENPVRLEMLKPDGLLLNEQWFSDNEEELKQLKKYPYSFCIYDQNYNGQKYRKYRKTKK